MKPEIVLTHRKEYLQEDGMLFVRNDGILETMVKAPLILAGLIGPHLVLLELWI